MEKKPNRAKGHSAPKNKSQSVKFQVERILESISDSFVALDTNWMYTYVNEKAAQTFGRTREQLIGKHIWTEFPEGVGQPFYKAYYKAMETQQPIFLEEYYPPYDRWFENRIYPSKDGLSIFFHDITDHKRAELSLLEAEEKYRSIFENAVEGIFQSTPQGRFIAVNPAMARIYGYASPQEMISSITDINRQIHADPQKRTEFIGLLNSKGFVEKFEARNLRKDGSVFWTKTNARAVRDANGKILYYEGFVTNITERKRAQEELQRNEQVLRLFVENSPAAIAMFDRDMKYIVASRRYLVDYDLGNQDVVGRSHYEIFPEIPERWKEIHRRCLAGAVESAEEDPFPRANGKLDWVRWEIHPVYETSGEIGGIILFSEVITERKQAEESLRESEERYRLLVNESPYAIGVHQDGKIVFANPSALRLFGAQNKEELIGKPILELIHPETQAAARERIGRMLQGETGLYPTEDRYLQMDGSVVPVEVTAAPFTHAGRPAIQVIALDITERKCVEEELRLHRDRLADLSRRLVEVHEAESRAIGRELHDQIGQMLTALKLTLEIASQLPPELREKKNKQTQELVNDLLKRVSALSLELRPPMLDDLGLIPALLWHINRFEEQTGIAVGFKHSGAEGRRFGAEVETTAYRVIQEAFTNIARHARAGRTRLEVHAGSGRMKIQIEDDGAGFDPQTAFEKHRGLGGMRERIGLLKGSLRIESQTGKGALLFIELPLKENA